MFRNISTRPLYTLRARCQSTDYSTSPPPVDHTSDHYQYLHKSNTPMLHFQPSLPRLPIPELNKTCERYLAAQRPLLDDESFERTKRIVDDFRTKDGPKLQSLLKASDKANKHTSYISDPWFDAYLTDRTPLPVNYNVALLMKPDERKDYNDQLLRSTNLVISTLRFRQSLRNHVLKPEVYHMNAKKSDTDTYHTVTRLVPSRISTYVSYAFNAFPLDMSQYHGLFGATRLPAPGKDRIVRNSDSRHIIIMKNGHFFAVDVLDANGNTEAPHVILGRLQQVHRLTLAAPEYPLGVLTSENRNTWAGLRQHLSNIGNEAALQQIDSALFCLCLDDGTLDEADPVPMVKNMMAGDAVNRWFDKSISLIVAADGTAAVHFEHSWGDGVAVLRYFNEIYTDSMKTNFVHPTTKPTSEHPNSYRPLEFKLDDHLQRGIRRAQSHHNAVMQRLAMNFCIYQGMNKRICKEFKLSPDSIMQLGFQLAFYKQYGKYVSTYESCSTAAFRHGRTETIRPCTVATKAFCDAVTAKCPPGKAELRAMIDACSKQHGALTREAAMGQGFDRHLFGLKHMAQLNDLETPDLYRDPAYAAINHNVMSSSTLSSPGLHAGAFGPVVADGLGIGYSIQDDMMGAIVSSYPEHRDGAGFIECLKEAYVDINKVVVV